MRERPGHLCRCCLATLALLLVFSVQARELAVDPDELVAVELATVGINPATRMPVVLLREPESGDILPIAIGIPEAQSIMRALQGVEPARPQTHDLVGSLLETLEARLERVIVDDLVQGTYLGALVLRRNDSDQTVLVDSRPSDALALAARSGATILVAPRILISARDLEYEGLEGDQAVTALGITVVEATAELRDALGLPDDAGVLVSGVRGDAEALGLQVGSLIMEVNGEAPESPMDFLELVRRTPDGEQATIRYWFEGDQDRVDLTTDVPRRERDEPGIRL